MLTGAEWFYTIATQWLVYNPMIQCVWKIEEHKKRKNDLPYHSHMISQKYFLVTFAFMHFYAMIHLPIL